MLLLQPKEDAGMGKVEYVIVPGNWIGPSFPVISHCQILISSTILLEEMQGPLESVNVFQNKDLISILVTTFKLR